MSLFARNKLGGIIACKQSRYGICLMSPLVWQSAAPQNGCWNLMPPEKADGG